MPGGLDGTERTLHFTCPLFQQSTEGATNKRFDMAKASLYWSAMELWFAELLKWLALPEVGLSTLFLIAAISATVLPLGSEPALLALVTVNPDLFWPGVLVATAGNTLGGAISWAMGLASHQLVDRVKHSHVHLRALDWLEKLGPKACLLSWLPVVGDPLCVVAGWLKMPLWPCVAYMAIGKFLRYALLTSVLLWVIP